MYPDKKPFELLLGGLRSVCCFALVAISAPASAEVPDGTCENVTPIELNTTIRDIGARCYEAYIGSTGNLWIDVSIPGVQS